MEKVSRDKVHEEFEPHYFTDYVLFTGHLRCYTAITLEEVFRSDPSIDHRRFFVIALYREEYSAYEDVGAIIDSFLRWTKKEVKFPLEWLLRYTPDGVRLEKLFPKRGIKSAEELYNALDLDNWIPNGWNESYPDIDCKKVLQRACLFIFKDCQSNQSLYRLDAYNQIKHGLKLVPNGSKFLPGLPNAPAVLISNDLKDSKDPYILMGIPMTDDVLEERLKVVDFIQCTLRFLCALYLIKQYPEILEKDRQISPALGILNTRYLIPVKEFLKNLSKVQ